MNPSTPRPLIQFLALLAVGCSFRHAVAQPNAVPPSAPSPSFVLFDEEITHRGPPTYKNSWDFESRRKATPGVPTDWLQGGENSFLNAGIYHMRVRVTRMQRAWDSPMTLQLGWSNFNGDLFGRHIASPQLRLTQLTPPPKGEPRVYELVGWVRSLDKVCMYYGRGPNADQRVTDWDWSRAFDPRSFYTIINSRDNKLDLDGDGRITEAEFPDISYHIVLTVHSPASPAHAFLAAQLEGFSSPAVSIAASPAER